MAAQDDAERLREAQALLQQEREAHAAQNAALQKQLATVQAELAAANRAQEALYPTADKARGGITPPDPRTPETIKAEAEKYPEFERPADALRRVNASTMRPGMAKDQNQLAPSASKDHDLATREYEQRQRDDTARAERLAQAPREHDAPAVRLSELQRADNQKLVEQQQRDRQREKENAKAQEAEQAKIVQAEAIAKRRELQTPQAQREGFQRVEAEAQQRHDQAREIQNAALAARREFARAVPAAAREVTALHQTQPQREAQAQQQRDTRAVQDAALASRREFARADPHAHARPVEQSDRRQRLTQLQAEKPAREQTDKQLAATASTGKGKQKEGPEVE